MTERTDDKDGKGPTPRKATALCDMMREHAEYMATYSEPFVGSTEAIAQYLRKGADYIEQVERELAEAKAHAEYEASRADGAIREMVATPRPSLAALTLEDGLEALLMLSSSLIPTEQRKLRDAIEVIKRRHPQCPLNPAAPVSPQVAPSEIVALNNAHYVEQWHRLRRILGMESGGVMDTVDEVERQIRVLTTGLAAVREREAQLSHTLTPEFVVCHDKGEIVNIQHQGKVYVPDAPSAPSATVTPKKNPSHGSRGGPEGEGP